VVAGPSCAITSPALLDSVVRVQRPVVAAAGCRPQRVKAAFLDLDDLAFRDKAELEAGS